MEAQPTRARMWENMGVTQMRMTMLDDAAKSFKTARKLDSSMTDENLSALKVNSLFPPRPFLIFTQEQDFLADM